MKSHRLSSIFYKRQGAIIFSLSPVVLDTDILIRFIQGLIVFEFIGKTTNYLQVLTQVGRTIVNPLDCYYKKRVAQYMPIWDVLLNKA